MAEKGYARLQDIEIPAFYLGAPLEIEKGALLLHRPSGTVLLQLRLTILESEKKISSASIKIWGSSDAREAVAGFSPFTYSFKDIHLLGARTFGENTPIVLDAAVRHVDIALERVVFTDGTVWRPPAKGITPPAQQPLKELAPGLFAQARRDAALLPPDRAKRVAFVPLQEKGYWLCVCGRANPDGAEECARCGIPKAWSFGNAVPEGIEKNLKKYTAAQKRLAARKKALAEKRKKLLIKASLLLTAAALAGAFAHFYLIPFARYARADRLLSREEFDRAAGIYAALGDYRDAPALAIESKYRKAQYLLAEGQFDAAINAFTGLEDYKNSPEMITESTYQRAVSLLENQVFDKAIALFTELGDYKDSAAMITESNYRKAAYLASSAKFDDALALYAGLTGYKNAADMITETNYRKAVWLIGEAQYKEAIQMLRGLTGYKETGGYLIEAYYYRSKEYLAEENFVKAVPLLAECGAFRDAPSLLREAREALFSQAEAAFRAGEFATAKKYFSKMPDDPAAQEYYTQSRVLAALQGMWEVIDPQLFYTLQISGWQVTAQTGPNDEDVITLEIEEDQVTADGVMLDLVSKQGFFGAAANTLTVTFPTGKKAFTKIS